MQPMDWSFRFVSLFYDLWGKLAENQDTISMTYVGGAAVHLMCVESSSVAASNLTTASYCETKAAFADPRVQAS